MLKTDQGVVAYFMSKVEKTTIIFRPYKGEARIL